MTEDAANSPLPEYEERRRSGRSRALLGGTIVFRDGAGTVACVIRNRTEQGIQLEIPANQLVPKRFYLITAKDNQVYEAELIWKKADRIGVVVGGRVDPSTTDARALQILKRFKRGHATNTEPDRSRKIWDDDRWPVQASSGRSAEIDSNSSARKLQRLAKVRLIDRQSVPLPLPLPLPLL